jgi:hypothetical protein
MTCVRLLEILPVLVDKLWLFGGKEHRNFTMLVKNKMGFKWLHKSHGMGKVVTISCNCLLEESSQLFTESVQRFLQ